MIIKELKDLVEISNYYGKQKAYVIAGGGNTSYKHNKNLWVKGSGTRLDDITVDGFVQLDRNKLEVISKKNYNQDPMQREQEVKSDLNFAILKPEKNIRPSVETSLHNIINYKYVVHTHPTLVNALICSKNSFNKVNEIFENSKEFNFKSLYISFIDPGYRLFKSVEAELIKFRKINNKDPEVIFLENHGVIVSADSIAEIKKIYNKLIKLINTYLKEFRIKKLDIDESCYKIAPVIRMLCSEKDKPGIVKIRNHTLIQYFYKDKKLFNLVAHPFTPDMVVYCKSNFIYIDKTGDTESIVADLELQIKEFRRKFNYYPKVVLIKNLGLFTVDNNAVCAGIVADVFEDLMQISYYSQCFGGPRFLTTEQINFIDNWEVENYRRSRATNLQDKGRVNNKIFIVTGGAQGFGRGIAEVLFAEGANIVIADIKEKESVEYVKELNSMKKANVVRFFKTDVSDYKSVKELVNFTVSEFGGVDVMLSNAGILYAGSLDEFSPATFELMTKVNYIGYFHCVKYASEVMKLQWRYNKRQFFDIIQINSKSGLKGSNKNFAYAGAKFGGIGLTQSFALELIQYNIKVNSICPGNFFDGPLWSDPDNGLFVQYLKTGKVPGAKTIADVRSFYENQVPAKRGCCVEDVMKAIFYIIEQDYETGQAIPVTGGQIMLK